VLCHFATNGAGKLEGDEAEEIGSKLTEDIGYTLTGEYALDR
jgi:hypothetical protein